jgi:hypothetical protein
MHAFTFVQRCTVDVPFNPTRRSFARSTSHTLKKPDNESLVEESSLEMYLDTFSKFPGAATALASREIPGSVSELACTRSPSGVTSAVDVAAACVTGAVILTEPSLASTTFDRFGACTMGADETLCEDVVVVGVAVLIADTRRRLDFLVESEI